MFLQTTTQSRVLQKASRSVLTAKRQEQGYTSTFLVAPDMPLDFRSLGKDLVSQLTGSVNADKDLDGRYVDMVTPKGRRIKVFSRIVRKTTKSCQAHLAGCELSCINFAKPKDSPDFIYLVVYNPFTSSVDVFKFPPRDPETREFNLTYSVHYSERSNSYCSKEKFKVASFTI